MKPEPQREAALFQAAAQLTGAERAAFLNGACHGDPVLRQRLEALLAAHDAKDSFLEPQAPKPGSQTVKTIKAGATVNPADDAVGRMVGHYKLLEKLGEGGCGAVYVAEQTEPVRRRVALKVIKLGMDTKAVIARFEAERQALAMMDHPNIAKVLDAGTTEAGRPYFIMELVRGIRITEYCDQNQLSTRERLDLFIKVCHAIQHAHQKGIIHRDIKPSNIMVTLHDGVPVPKVIDFGIAKATEGRLTDATVYTQLHQFVGTPAYISPEQAEMSGLDIDTRSDIYSLGVLLYELLIGSTPFDANELMASGIDGMRKMIREKEPVRPSTRLLTLQGEELTTTAKRRASDAPKLVHQLKGDLDWIVMKCLEKDRTRRYETANGLASDLKRHLNNEPVLARPPSKLYLFQKMVRRNKLAFTAAAVTSAVLVLGAIVCTWQAVRATHAKHDAIEARNHEQALLEAAQQAKAKETQMREQAQEQELEARQRAYASDMNVAKQALDENNLGRAQDLLDRQRPQPGQKDLRGWEWRYLWQQCRSDASSTLCQKSSEIDSLAVSQDGQWLAIGQERGGLSVRDLRTREDFPLAQGGFVYAVFSPTEPLLAFSTSVVSASGEEKDSLRLWNAVTRQMIGPFPLNSRAMGLAFSKDGRRLVTSTSSFGKEGRITLWRIPEGTEVTNYPSDQEDLAGSATAFAATPDLSLAAYGQGRGGMLCLMDLRDGKTLWTNNASKEWVTALAFSPDGKTLASAGGFDQSDTDIRLWDVASGKETGRLKGHEAWVGSLVFWPDGRKLASSSADQTIRTWDVPGTNELDVLRGHRLEVWRLALLPDNKTLVSGCKDGTVCFWDTSVSHSHEARITLPKPVTAWHFSPDSQSVVTLDPQGHVIRWRGRDFQQPETLFEIGTNRYLEYDTLSGDGRWLAVTTTSNVLEVWDMSRGQRWHELPRQPGKIWAQSFSADGNKLFTWSGDDNLLREWDLNSNSSQPIQKWREPSEFCATAFSPDQRLWLGACFGVGALLEDLTGEGGVKTNLDFQEISGAAFSPDGKLFAIASCMGYARVWETNTWREVKTLRGYRLGVNAAAFSGDGNRLVACGSGKDALKLWDTDPESWQEVLTLEGQGSGFSSMAISPDGKAIGAMNTGGNAGGAMHIWRAPSWDEINAAEAAETKGQHP